MDNLNSCVNQIGCESDKNLMFRIPKYAWSTNFNNEVFDEYLFTKGDF